MTGRPVNIAEFRCRAVKARISQFPLRDVNRSSAMKVEPLVLRDVSEESAEVFDIGMARDAQRIRRRANLRSGSLPHRANVIRFGESQRRAVAAMQAPQSWRPSQLGPCDLPPAA